MPRSQEAVGAQSQLCNASRHGFILLTDVFVHIGSLPGPEDTVRKAHEKPSLLSYSSQWRRHSKQLITQLVSIMMKTTVKEKRDVQKGHGEEGQT